MAGKLEKQKAKKGIKIFIGYVLRYRRDITIIAILNIAGSLVSGSSPYVSGKLFDSILSENIVHIGTRLSIPLWLFILYIWLLIQVVGRLIDWVNSIRKSYFIISMTDDYVIEGSSKLFRLPIAFHKENKKGNSINRVDRAANKLNQAINFAFEFIPQMLSIMVGLFFVFWINYVFGFLLLFMMSLYLLFMVKIVKPARKLRKKAFKRGNDAYGNLYDAIGNIKTVKQSGTEKYEEKRFYRKIVNGAQFYWKKIIRININLELLQRVIVLLTQLAVFVISIYFIRADRMTLGQLFAVNGYTALTFGPLAYVVRWWNWLTDAFVALERAEKIFGEKSEEYGGKGSDKIVDIDGNIQFVGVNFHYEDTKNQKGNEVLRNVSFRINEGETVAIVGESGVGKTTIADLISGFYFPQKGQILVGGVPTNKIPLTLLRKKIAVVSQDITIFNETIGYNIKYGNFSVDEKMVINVAKEAGAHEFIVKFKRKYKQKVGERGIKLSGGQRQRIAIAQAILNNSPILILDEPTSALDAKTESVVAKSLEKLMKGKTTIIIAHRLATVRKADKIIVLDKGRVVEQGKHDELIKIKNGVYRKFYDLQKL